MPLGSNLNKKIMGKKKVRSLRKKVKSFYWHGYSTGKKRKQAKIDSLDISNLFTYVNIYFHFYY